MDCPSFTAKSPQRPGELEPFTCPIVYCPPSLDENENQGNFTFSICVKHVDNINSDNQNFIKRTCATEYEFCRMGCDEMKGRWIGSYVREISYNYTKYTAVGCEQGDLTTIRNKSSVFPSSSQVILEVLPHLPTKSGSSHNQTTIMLPWFFMLILIYSFVHRKL